MSDLSYIEIKAPELSHSEYGRNIAEQFDNINTNFLNILSSAFLKGPQGDSVSNIEVNLNSSEPTDIYIGDKNMTGLDFLNSLRNTVVENFKKNELDETYPEELGEIKIIGVEGLKNEVIHWDDYLKDSKIVMICEKSNDGLSTKYKPVSSMIFVLRDARYDALYKVYEANKHKLEENKYDWYERLVDVSSAIQFDSNTNKFVRFMSFPSLYYDKNLDNFCWKINGNKTGLTATGPRGPKGNDGKCWIVQVSNERTDTDDSTLGENIYIITKVLRFKVVSNLVIYEFVNYNDYQFSEDMLFGENSSAVVFKENEGTKSFGNYWISPILYKTLGFTKVPVVYVNDALSIDGLLSNIAFLDMLRYIGPTKNKYSNGISNVITPGLFVPEDNSVASMGTRAVQPAHVLLAVNKKLGQDGDGLETPISNLQLVNETSVALRKNWDSLMLTHMDNVLMGYPTENFNSLRVKDFFINYNTHFKGRNLTIDDDRLTVFMQPNKIGYKVPKKDYWSFDIGVYNDEFNYNDDEFLYNILKVTGNGKKPTKFSIGEKSVAAGGSSPSFTIDYKTGFIGVNKELPEAALDVVGDLRVTGSINMGVSPEQLQNSGNHSTSFGGENQVTGSYSYAEGYQNISAGTASHAEGSANEASGEYSHAGGYGNISFGDYSYAEGHNNVSSGNSSHAEGTETRASGNSSHSEGNNTTAFGENSHAEGLLNIAAGAASHAEGNGVVLSVFININKDLLNIVEVTDGYIDRDHIKKGAVLYFNGECNPIVNVDNSTYQPVCTLWGDVKLTEELIKSLESYNILNTMAEIRYGAAVGKGSHSEGLRNTAFGEGSHVEGKENVTFGIDSHVEGMNNWATINSEGSHVEGCQNKTQNRYTHTEGYQNETVDEGSHAEGKKNKSHGLYSHVEGENSRTNGNGSHAEGYNTETNGDYSHAEGRGTKTINVAEHAEGTFNLPYEAETNINGETKSYHSISSTGFGLTAGSRRNVMSLSNLGHMHIYAVNGYNGTNPTYENSLQYALNNLIGRKNPLKEGETVSTEFGNNFTIGGTDNIKENPVNNLGEIFNEYTGLNKAEGDYSHAEGKGTVAGNCVIKKIIGEDGQEETLYIHTGEGSHAEGLNTKAIGEGSHAEGKNNISKGDYSHAEGLDVNANGDYSHASGLNTITSNSAETACGTFNVSNTGGTDNDKTMFSIGIGASDSNRKNGLEVRKDGLTMLFSLKGFEQPIGYLDSNKKSHYLRVDSYIGSKPITNVEIGDGTIKPNWIIHPSGKIESADVISADKSIISGGNIEAKDTVKCSRLEVTNGFVGSQLLSVKSYTGPEIKDNILIEKGYDYIVINKPADKGNTPTNIVPKLILFKAEDGDSGRTIYFSSKIKCTIEAAQGQTFRLGYDFNSALDEIELDSESIFIIYIGDGIWSVFFTNYNKKVVGKLLNDLNNKLDILVSGKNIKTIKNESILMKNDQDVNNITI